MGATGIIICSGILLVLSFAVAAGGEAVFNVVGFGARGNGMADDTEAFEAAWSATCRAEAPSVTMLVPAWRTFLVGPNRFEGPCVSQNITEQVMGTIVATPADTWRAGKKDHWLMFSPVYGLIVTGNGVLDGNGQSWIRRCHAFDCVASAPTALMLVECNKLQLLGFSSKNSPQMHIAILNSWTVYVDHLTVTAPGNSPNTDGIHIERCNDVWISNSNIGTGDDCVSIGPGSRFVTVRSITCGPGHGVSIGSLGKDGAAAAVEYINVSYVRFINTLYGARIKTWQGGEGYAKSISFSNIEFTDIDNPVLINQFHQDLNVAAHGAVAISNITYANLRGTSSQKMAVAFDCSKAGSCTEVHVNNMRITGPGARGTIAHCENVQGDTSGYVYPSILCLK